MINFQKLQKLKRKLKKKEEEEKIKKFPNGTQDWHGYIQHKI